MCVCTHAYVCVLCVPQTNVGYLPQLLFNSSFFESVSLTEHVVTDAARQAGPEPPVFSHLSIRIATLSFYVNAEDLNSGSPITQLPRSSSNHSNKWPATPSESRGKERLHQGWNRRYQSLQSVLGQTLMSPRPEEGFSYCRGPEEASHHQGSLSAPPSSPGSKLFMTQIQSGDAGPSPSTTPTLMPRQDG